MKMRRWRGAYDAQGGDSGIVTYAESTSAQHLSGKPARAVGTTKTPLHTGEFVLMGHQLLQEENLEVPQWLPYTLSPRYTLRESLEALVHYLESQGEEAVVGRTQL